jgi:hypothetical protein
MSNVIFATLVTKSVMRIKVKIIVLKGHRSQWGFDESNSSLYIYYSWFIFSFNIVFFVENSSRCFLFTCRPCIFGTKKKLELHLEVVSHLAELYIFLSLQNLIPIVSQKWMYLSHREELALQKWHEYTPSV